ncbi:hypothetical protein [Erythrobacter sp. EC-HK427]|uniref:hypothetical protein n=1 Tax=Erythrobacter sp. EC-HK427 TaxID=2038396 RepID=UPI001258E4CE|nr:hypothetical protein [Erythrobacter sp. EC-HK427]VVT19878.1 exported hypothetical protein [Erythrobacter sp. EC-HK427]
MKFSSVYVAAFVLGASVTPAMAQEDAQAPVRWQQSPIIILPGATERLEREFVEGEAVLELPLRWAFSTRLSRDVVIEQDGETLTLPAGELLPKALLDNGEVAYCTRSRVAEAQEGSGFMGAMFGSMLNSLQDKVVCLQDSDKDLLLDRAIVLGDGPGIVDLGAVEPLAFEDLMAEPMGTADDIARISMIRVGRSVVQLQLDVIQRGSTRSFDTWQSGRFTARRFNDVRFGEGNRGGFYMFGLRFEVIDAVRQENRATLRVTPEINPTEFVVVPSEVRTTYGW